MRSFFLRSIVLALSVLMILTACAPSATQEDTTVAPETLETEADNTTEESETQAGESYIRDTYEDLSHNVPAPPVNNTSSVTVVSEGVLSAQDVVLDFTTSSGIYTVSSFLASGHDSNTCDTCGYLPDGEGYLLRDHGYGLAGIRIDLVNHLPADTVKSLEAVFTTSVDASASQLRILKAKETDTSVIKNSCPSMGGAVGQEKTLDLTLNDPLALADSNGNISAFQIYFRNKSSATCTLKKLIFRVDPERYLDVEELQGNFYGRGDVLNAIANSIAKRLTAANIGAEIRVESGQFKKNGSDSNGTLRYNIEVTYADGTTVSRNGKITVPALSGSWLDDSDSSTGSSHDNLGQWQDTFDPSGMVLLTNNTISAAENVVSAQYALIPESGDHTDGAVVWHTPHVLEMEKNAIKALFVNSWLDYGDSMTEGERYRLLVRGVTENSNYILHLDIPFTYSSLDQAITDKITSAVQTLNETQFLCPEGTTDKVAYIREKFTGLLNDPSLDLHVKLLAEGVNSATAQVTVLCNTSVTAQRLPNYVLNGQDLSSVYAYEGHAVTTGVLYFPGTEYEGNIQLLTPYDGDASVVLASLDIYNLFNASLSEIQSARYPFKWGENCLPVPAELTWSDSDGGEKTYTVTVSKKLDMSEPIVLTSDECSIKLYNLEIGRIYYWQVTDGENTSQLFTFTTAMTPRFFSVEGVSNFRDIGGYYTADGKRVKQNLVFRSAILNDATAEAKDFMLNTLGIKTELDLRGSGEPTFANNAVNRQVIGMMWYSNVLSATNYETTRQTISAFADPANYPILFHCHVGRDRTGTTSVLILGLLGVDEETILKEHYSSYFSSTGYCDPAEYLIQVTYMQDFLKGLRAYAPEGATLQEQIQGYLLRIGVTQAEIDSIRSILLED